MFCHHCGSKNLEIANFCSGCGTPLKDSANASTRLSEARHDERTVASTESNKGYLYVLANSAMPDMVKVGKTKRQPSQRAQELSGVTGVPTPFIVVFEKLMRDCDAAENFVHTILARKGYRVSDNREFFSAPVSEVVEAVLQVPQQWASGSPNEWAYSEDDGGACEVDDGDDDGIDGNDVLEAEPWRDVWEAAEAYHFGLGDCLEDNAEALSLYKQAATLGCHVAYHRIGDIFHYGEEGVAENHQRALYYFKEGAKRGDYSCYLEMAVMFFGDDNPENARKCLSLFFEKRNANLDPFVETEMIVMNTLVNLIEYHISDVRQLPNNIRNHFAAVKDDLTKAVDKNVGRTFSASPTAAYSEYKVAQKWISELGSAE